MIFIYCDSYMKDYPLRREEGLAHQTSGLQTFKVWCCMHYPSPNHKLSQVINPRRTCARVTVVVLCVCVCLSVYLLPC